LEAAVTPTSLPVVEVTVLEDRARVVRRGVAAVPAGQSRVVVSGVAPVLVDKTLTATATATASGARVLDVRCKRRLAPHATGDGGADAVRGVDAAELAAKVEAAEAEVQKAAAEQAVTEREAQATATLRQVVLGELAGEAAWGRLPGGAAEELARIDAREREIVKRATQQAFALERARRDLEALRARAREAARDAGAETAEVEIDLVAEAAGDAEITIEYLVPGACWRPYHTATLTGGAAQRGPAGESYGLGGRVAFATDACVWQSTGEDWREVRLAFSTERPSLGASPPRLADDPVRVQRRSEVIVVEMRDHDLDQTGLGADRSVATAAEVPGVDDGGIAQTLRPAHPATIPSDGRPYRVAIGAHEAPAELALVAMPERAPCAFTRTRQASGDRPLLAGPVDLIRDAGHVGRTSILYVAPGERFELGWGPESDVRIHRDERKMREDPGVLSSWNQSRVKVALRLSNLGETPRTVEITERIPVSEIEKVEVKLDTDGLRADDDGFLRWTVELPPRGHHAIDFELVLRWHNTVAMP
jgi:uncharacterized protein (TIGR02231 family)